MAAYILAGDALASAVWQYLQIGSIQGVTSDANSLACVYGGDTVSSKSPDAWRYFFQVVGIYAEPVTAGLVNDVAVRDCAFEVRVKGPVRKESLLANRCQSIAVTQGAFPQPAVTVCIDIGRQHSFYGVGFP